MPWQGFRIRWLAGWMTGCLVKNGPWQVDGSVREMGWNVNVGGICITAWWTCKIGDEFLYQVPICCTLIQIAPFATAHQSKGFIFHDSHLISFSLVTVPSSTFPCWFGWWNNKLSCGFWWAGGGGGGWWWWDVCLRCLCLPKINIHPAQNESNL